MQSDKITELERAHQADMEKVQPKNAAINVAQYQPKKKQVSGLVSAKLSSVEAEDQRLFPHPLPLRWAIPPFRRA